MKVKIAAACVPDVKGDKKQNFAIAVEMTKQLASAGAQIVVLPEVCLQGYPAAQNSFRHDDIKKMAETLDGSYVQQFRALARELGVYLVTGYDRLDGNDLFNTAELISPKGATIGIYDKTHVRSGGDVGLYTPGAALPVFETEFGKVGLLICNDRVYAECWRVLMLQGAQMVLIPSNGEWGEANTRRMQVMANDNCVGCAFAHPKRGLVISSKGGIVDYDGDELKPFALGELDLSDVAERQASLRQRRRVDLYQKWLMVDG
jgi:predicted amidohydrolase